jgi:hypothetical protein
MKNLLKILSRRADSQSGKLDKGTREIDQIELLISSLQEYESTLREYYKLSQTIPLSEIEAKHFEKILEYAQSDSRLSDALDCIDELTFQGLNFLEASSSDSQLRQEGLEQFISIISEAEKLGKQGKTNVWSLPASGFLVDKPILLKAACLLLLVGNIPFLINSFKPSNQMEEFQYGDANGNADIEDIESLGVSIISGVAGNAEGSGGNFQISTNSFLLGDGDSVITSSLGQDGQGNGSIILSEEGINVESSHLQIVPIDQGQLAEAQLGVQTSPIYITAPRLMLQDGAVISASAMGEGIEIRANNLTLKDGDAFQTSTFGQVNAGKVSVLKDRTRISSSATREGIADDIQAQGIIPDRTLGEERWGVTFDPTLLVRGGMADLISGGTTRGSALFHSFSEFNVNAGQRVYFGNPDDIATIFRRVTGGNLSNDTKEYVEGVNRPTLDIRAGTTVFGTPTLGPFTSPPSLGGIARTEGGGNLEIISHGGTIDISDQLLISSARGQGGKITLWGRAGIQANNSILHSTGTAGGKITLESGGGSIDTTNSLVNSGSLPTQVQNRLYSLGITLDPKIITFLNLAGSGADIELRAADDIKTDIINTGGHNLNIHADGQLQTTNSILNTGLRNGLNGAIYLRHDRGIVNLAPNSQAVDLSLNASDFIQLDQSIVEVSNGTEKPNGNIAIHTDGLILENGAIVSTSAGRERATAGSIQIDATMVEVLDSTTNSPIFSNPLFNTEFSLIAPEVVMPTALISMSGGPGNAGDIFIDTNQLLVSDSALISTASLAAKPDAGAGGNISINGREFGILSNHADNQFLTSGISVNTLTSQPTDQLQIVTPKLEITGGATISASTFSSGQGGNISITAADILVQGASPDQQIHSGIYAQSFSTENAGGIRLDTNTLNLQNQAQLVVNIDFQGKDSANLIGKARASINKIRKVQTITGDSITGTTVVERELGFGNAGNIEIRANNITLEDSGVILAEMASGEGGDINLQTTDLRLLDNSQIITNVQGETTRGNITINTELVPLLGNSDITANAWQGSGGPITIKTQGLFRSEDADITATSQRGPDFDGVVNINVELDPSQGVLNLLQGGINVSLFRGCYEAQSGGNRFLVTGQGGTAASSQEFLFDQVWQDLPTVPNQPSIVDWIERGKLLP